MRRNPLLHERGARKVSFAVPTTSICSPPRAANETTAIENAASLLSNGMKFTVLDCIANINLEIWRSNRMNLRWQGQQSGYQMPKYPRELLVFQTRQEGGSKRPRQSSRPFAAMRRISYAYGNADSSLTISASFAFAASSPRTRWSPSIKYRYPLAGWVIIFRGVYDRGIASCLSFVPNFGIWNIL